MLSLLLSAESATSLSDRIADVLGGVPFRVVELESLDPNDASTRIDAAFLSRDITGAPVGAGPSPARAKFIDVLRRSPSLRWVHIHQAGADARIWPELQARGVTVTTSQGANAKPVALSALGGIIALERQFADLIDAQRRKRWEPPFGSRTPRDLAGQTAMVVGLGPVGQEIARLLGMVGMDVVGVRRSSAPDARCRHTITYEEIDRFLPSVDWLVLACPLTTTTLGLVNGARLALLRPTARLVNIARGAVVDEPALIDALAGNRIGGAYLDVFMHEPLSPDSPLWAMPGVLVSPHAASFSTGNGARVAAVFLDNLGRFQRSEPLLNDAASLH